MRYLLLLVRYLLLLVGWPFAVTALGALLYLSPFILSRAADEPASQALRTEKTIAELIKQLGNDSFAIREAATRELIKRDEAAPALRKALQSPDLEVATRAAWILQEQARQADRRPLDPQADRQALARLRTLAKAGEVDQVAERLARRRKGGDEDAWWQVVTELTSHLLDLERQSFHPKLLQPLSAELMFRDFRQYQATARPLKLTPPLPIGVGYEGVYLIRGEDISIPGPISRSLIVSSGPVRTGILQSKSVIFAGGPVEVEGSVLNSVIVCDGELTVRTALLVDCLMVCRGTVKCDQDRIGPDVVIVTTGTVEAPKGFQAFKSTIRQNEAVPLGFVKFFDPARVGIAVAEAEGGVRLQAVAAGQRFAQAGLRAGDVLSAVDGTAVGSPEAFRRLLRRKLAEGGDATFHVRRDGKPLDIRVPCDD